MLVARDQPKVILQRKGCDPEIVVRYRSTGALELYKHSCVLICRLAIRQQKSHCGQKRSVRGFVSTATLTSISSDRSGAVPEGLRRTLDPASIDLRHRRSLISKPPDCGVCQLVDDYLIQTLLEPRCFPAEPLVDLGRNAADCVLCIFLCLHPHAYMFALHAGK